MIQHAMTQRKSLNLAWRNSSQSCRHFLDASFGQANRSVSGTVTVFQNTLTEFKFLRVPAVNEILVQPDPTETGAWCLVHHHCLQFCLECPRRSKSSDSRSCTCSHWISCSFLWENQSKASMCINGRVSVYVVYMWFKIEYQWTMKPRLRSLCVSHAHNSKSHP